MKHLFIFKKLALITFAVFFNDTAFSQNRLQPEQTSPITVESGSLDYLLACNGFNLLKLGANVKNLQKDKLGYLDGIDSLDTDSCYKMVYQDDALLNLGN